MKKSAMIIINPTAGKEKGSEYENMIKAAIGQEYPDVLIKYTEAEGDATSFAQHASREGFDLVVTLGGDGTVNEVVNGLACFDKPPLLGIIPMGTVNDLARALKIPIQPEKAIELLHNGVQKQIDVGLANKHYFTNILGIGNPAKAIHSVGIAEKTRFGPFAYVRAVANEILEDDKFLVKLEMDEKTWEGEAAVIIVALIDSFGGLKSIFTDVEKGDGNFYIFAIKRLNVAEIIKMTPSLLTGKIAESENVKYFKSTKIKIDILSEHKRESDIDGEKGPDLPLEITILPRHLTVISGKD